MKKGSTVFLRFVIGLLAVGVLVGLVWFPQTEGRAAGLNLFQIYADPLILFVYIGSIPFFVGLYQALKFLHLIDANKAFSQAAVNTIRNMKFASLCQIVFVAGAVLFIRFFAHGDDPAGPTGLGMVAIFATGVIAAGAVIFQKLLQHAVDIKSENDLTV